jgi:hypothetical protein
MSKSLLLIACMSLSGTGFAAGIYKCEDASGKLTYQSRPCNTEQQRQTVIQEDKNAPPPAPPAKAGAAASAGKTPDDKKAKSKDEKKEKKNTGHRYEKERFVGTWCFYEQTAFQHTEPEKVTIKLNNDGSYHWNDAAGVSQTGKWSLQENDILNLTNVGNHTILKVTAELLELQRYSVMKWRKGGC